ncbi:hypothetical protein ACFVYJ_08380 [Pontibacter sp. JAM-7]|uniref:hypothetical protein n=1 Tax=Pontibacter sp. JAM-7 TaxID=3366581 RepID=UPI003AF42801
MMRLELQTGKVIQGELTLSRLNLMLVFQVNCPGCLNQALPQLQALQPLFPRLNLFALSTAFEDFALNTAENTRLLLDKGYLTQASARYFSRLGHRALPYRISVPVIMDRFAQPGQIEAMRSVLEQALSDMGLDQKPVQQTMAMLNARLQPVLYTGRTFLNNQLQGTPSWILFDSDMMILDQWFGHRPLEWLEAQLSKHSNSQAGLG